MGALKTAKADLREAERNLAQVQSACDRALKKARMMVAAAQRGLDDARPPGSAPALPRRFEPPFPLHDGWGGREWYFIADGMQRGEYPDEASATAAYEAALRRSEERVREVAS